MEQPKQETIAKTLLNVLKAQKQFNNDTWQHWVLAISMWVFLIFSITAIANLLFIINHLNRL